MSEGQKRQFNRMRETLRRIAYRYLSTKQIHKRGEAISLTPEEEIEMSYDNIQAEAKYAVKGIKEIK